MIAKGAKVIATRWVFTDKHANLRDKFPNIALLAKARLVVIGCLEDTSSIRGDAPTCSLLGLHLLCSVTASNKWKLRKFDAKNAYLQSGGIERVLLLNMPNPPPPGELASSIRAITKEAKAKSARS